MTTDDETAAYLANRSANAPQHPIVPLDQRQRVPAPDPNDPATHRMTVVEPVPMEMLHRVPAPQPGQPNRAYVRDLRTGDVTVVDDECAMWHGPDGVPRSWRDTKPHVRTDAHRQALIDAGHSPALVDARYFEAEPAPFPSWGVDRAVLTSDELPGMWDKSDFQGGEADMTSTDTSNVQTFPTTDPPATTAALTGENALNPVGPRTAQWHGVWEGFQILEGAMRDLKETLDKLADTDTTPEG